MGGAGGAAGGVGGKEGGGGGDAAGPGGVWWAGGKEAEVLTRLATEDEAWMGKEWAGDGVGDGGPERKRIEEALLREGFHQVVQQLREEVVRLQQGGMVHEEEVKRVRAEFDSSIKVGLVVLAELGAPGAFSVQSCRICTRSAKCQPVNSLSKRNPSSTQASRSVCRGTSLVTKRTPLGPHRRPLSKVLGGS